MPSTDPVIFDAQDVAGNSVGLREAPPGEEPGMHAAALQQHERQQHLSPFIISKGLACWPVHGFFWRHPPMPLSKIRASHVLPCHPSRNRENGIHVFLPALGNGIQLWLCACRPPARRLSGWRISGLTVVASRIDPIAAALQLVVRWWHPQGAQ